MTPVRKKMPNVRQLYQLQELDLAVEARQVELADVTARLADRSEIAAAGERLQKLESDAAGLGKARRGLERAVEELVERLQKVDDRLYSGTVTNPKEWTAAEEERSFIRARRSENEDKLLDVMVDLEGREEARSQAEGTLQRLEAERPGLEAELTEEQRRLSAELAELNRRRDNLAPQLGADVAVLYESLRRSKGGRAVAVVERGMCQGCRVALSTGQLQQVRINQNLVQCSSCHRILYLA